jgi:hypothetical protein
MHKGFRKLEHRNWVCYEVNSSFAQIGAGHSSPQGGCLMRLAMRVGIQFRALGGEQVSPA